MAREFARQGAWVGLHYNASEGPAKALFGDFFFVEALCRVVQPGRLRPEISALA